MTFRRNTILYLAVAIAGCSDAEARDWREQIKKHYPCALDPMRRDYRYREVSDYREIVELDKRDIRACDIVLAHYARPSVGTSMEIFYAHSLEKPVVLWRADANIALSPWLLYHATCIVDSLQSALDKLKELEA